MDHPSYCRGDCTGAAIETADGHGLCQSCGLSLEARKAKCRTVIVTNTPHLGKPPTQVEAAPWRASEPLPPAESGPAPIAQTRPCETCSRGQVGVARWEAGVRNCTTCQPLKIVALGVNKAADVFALEASPEDVASGRRRG